jgi:hypothetical protein
VLDVRLRDDVACAAVNQRVPELTFPVVATRLRDLREVEAVNRDLLAAHIAEVTVLDAVLDLAFVGDALPDVPEPASVLAVHRRREADRGNAVSGIDVHLFGIDGEASEVGQNLRPRSRYGVMALVHDDAANESLICSIRAGRASVWTEQIRT